MVANLIYIMGSALLMVVGWNTVELNEWFDQHVGFFWLKAFADVHKVPICRAKLVTQLIHLSHAHDDEVSVTAGEVLSMLAGGDD